jgi:predicted transposase/invertase (TIGR01784 family)
VLNPDVPREAVEDKGIVLDLRVQLTSGQQVDVEMQSQQRPARRQRALYYWARMYAAQLARGEPFSSLRQCVVVFIFDFNEFEGDRFHSVFHARQQHGGAELSNHFELHFLELPKLESAGTSMDEPLLRGWGKFLKAQSEADLAELTMTHPVFQQAKSALERLSADPEARRQAEDREVALFLHNVELHEARSEGEALGRAEGEALGRAEGEALGRAEGEALGRATMLIELLTRKFGEMPEAVRARVQSAGQAEHSRWADRVLFADSIDAVFED